MVKRGGGGETKLIGRLRLIEGKQKQTQMVLVGGLKALSPCPRKRYSAYSQVCEVLECKQTTRGYTKKIETRTQTNRLASIRQHARSWLHLSFTQIWAQVLQTFELADTTLKYKIQRRVRILAYPLIPSHQPSY